MRYRLLSCGMLAAEFTDDMADVVIPAAGVCRAEDLSAAHLTRYLRVRTGEGFDYPRAIRQILRGTYDRYGGLPFDRFWRMAWALRWVGCVLPIRFEVTHNYLDLQSTTPMRRHDHTDLSSVMTLHAGFVWYGVRRVDQHLVLFSPAGPRTLGRSRTFCRATQIPAPSPPRSRSRRITTSSSETIEERLLTCASGGLSREPGSSEPSDRPVARLTACPSDIDCSQSRPAV